MVALAYHPVDVCQILICMFDVKARKTVPFFPRIFPTSFINSGRSVFEVIEVILSEVVSCAAVCNGPVFKGAGVGVITVRLLTEVLLASTVLPVAASAALTIRSIPA